MKQLFLIFFYFRDMTFVLSRHIDKIAEYEIIYQIYSMDYFSFFELQETNQKLQKWRHIGKN